MRTSYPTPSFSDQYKYKIVDSTFIHAIHLAKSKGGWTYSLGVSLQKDQDTIIWYIVKDPVGLYVKLTDPKKSPGFTYNNSVKGKQFTKQSVVDKVAPGDRAVLKDLWDTYEKTLQKNKNKLKLEPIKSEKEQVSDILCDRLGKTVNSVTNSEKLKKELEAIGSAFAGLSMRDETEGLRQSSAIEKLKKELEAMGATFAGKGFQVDTNAKGFAIPKKPDPTPLPTTTGSEPTSFSYGPRLDTCGKSSSVIGYLGLGFNKATKGLVIYYSFKKNPHNVYAIQTDDATLYRDWINAESLGKFFNLYIKGNEESVLLRMQA